MDTESAVRKRYAAAAQAKENSLCCAVDYDAKYLEAIPVEVIERDYGCGDPSQYLRESETVLDLGSGTGKICFIAAQVVGPGGRAIGVDMTDEMLEIARRNAPLVAEKIGYENVEFRKGRIQDLALDFELLEAELDGARLDGLAGFLEAESIADMLRVESPMVADGSVDVVVSNCVLNLVAQPAKRQLFGEVFRVLKPGGRAVISDIISNADVPAEMQADEELWSGCISGALRENKFLRAFAEVGFDPIRILSREEQPWQTHENIEFRSMTVEAIKPATDNSRFFVPSAETSPTKKCC